MKNISETEEDPKPCPVCKSENIKGDADGLVTSALGIDYQNIWVECLDCGFDHTINVVDFPMEDEPSQLCVKQRNQIPTDTGSV